MSIIVSIEIAKNKIKKSSLEALNYASKIASSSIPVIAVSTHDSGSADLSDLFKAGANKLILSPLNDNQHADPRFAASALQQIMQKENSSLIVFSHDFGSKSVAPLLSAKINAGIVPAAVSLPDTENGYAVKKNVFSGKATATYQLKSEKKIICLLPNTFAVELTHTNAQQTENFSADFSGINSTVKVRALKKAEGEINLPDAELVVSAGRGMKGPEHWGIVEELAQTLGAATACSRPVSDIGWRPHHEHVGQTGIAIRPNLYIAIGISGAIQHLAGVNGSKTIVVINKDPEAPFFKSADYGVIGDAFEIVPKLTEAFKKFKTNH